MPTNFERAKIVVDALLPVAADLVNGSVDEMVGNRLSSLRFAYNGQLLRDGRKAVDYGKLTTKIAYVYRSLPAHADWLYQALSLVPRATTEILSSKNVKIACVGGGPGSDMLGVTKFIEQNNLRRPNIDLTVLDFDQRWARVRDELFSTFDFELRTHVSQDFDATRDGTWTSSWAFLDADIITFSFSLSEFWSFNGEGCVSRFLDRVLTGIRRGALIVYVDNGGPDFSARMEAEFDRDDLRLIGTRDGERIFMGFDEQRDVIEEAFKARFKGEWTKVQGNLSLRVWKKL